jgi:hypothetical protein
MPDYNYVADTTVRAVLEGRVPLTHDNLSYLMRYTHTCLTKDAHNLFVPEYTFLLREEAFVAALSASHADNLPVVLEALQLYWSV